MKRLILASALLSGGMLALSNSPAAHGGVYNGPGDLVPPAGGGSNGEGPGPGPGAPGPTTPGATSQPGAAPRGPQLPGASPSGSPVQTLAGNSAVDLSSWKFWWELNKRSYLNIKSRIHAGAVSTGATDFFIGHGEVEVKDTLAPTKNQIAEVIVPALLRVLDTESNNDIITGALIALAKIGDVRSENGVSEFEARMSHFLADPNREISETAALSLGILASQSSIGILEDLLADSAHGRRQLVKSSEVPYRTRSFAAYGLGLIAARSSDEQSKRRIVEILVRAIESDDTRSRDLKVACIISLGLAPLAEIEGQHSAEESPAPDSCRDAQVQYLFDYLNDETNEYLVRAHCPTALARLVPVDSLNPTLKAWRAKLIADFQGRCSKQSKERNEVVQSAIGGLGLLGDNAEAGLGAEVRQAIMAIPANIKDQQSRNFSMIAAAKAGGQSSQGQSQQGAKEVADFLGSHLSRGKSSIRPWAGLAIGVLCEKLGRDSDAMLLTRDAARALREQLAEESNVDRIGAYAISAGIMHDEDSKPILLDYLAKLRESESRGYVCVALALMGAGEASATLREIVAESKYKPELLKQAAVALGHLGDKDLVPMLTGMLAEATGLYTQASLASALGSIGDKRSVDPLVGMLLDAELAPAARGFAAVALGIVADKELLPWNTKIAEDLNYRASTPTLLDNASGTGILDIL